MNNNKIKLLFLKAFVVGIPSYTVAFLTEKVTLVVPTIAMFLLVANSIESGAVSNRNRLDEDGNSLDDGDAGDAGDAGDGSFEGNDGST